MRTYKKIYIFFCLVAFNLIYAQQEIAHVQQLLENGQLVQAENQILKLFEHTIHQDQLIRIGNLLLNLGNAYYTTENFVKSAEVFKRLHGVYPQSSTVLYNLALALNELSLYNQAAHALQQACALKPDCAEYHVAYATALIGNGQLKHGFSEYEWRWQLPDKKNLSYACPRYQGQQLKNKTLVLLGEGALGDCLQFIRYAAYAKSQGARVIVRTFASLHPLLALCPYVDQLLTQTDPLPHADYYTSLMSMPAYCNAQTFDAQPYLYVDPQLVAYWRQKLSTNTNFKVGICWQADTANDANRPQIARRSISVELFELLASIDGLSLYSLQKGVSVPWFIQSLGADFDQSHGSFMDSAAVIAELDLIICVDTSIAHLAGGLAKPVWLLLPQKSDWRWQKGCATSCWYTNTTLFCCTDQLSFKDLIVEMHDKLNTLIAKKKR